jgi:hypothetical protein
MLDADELPAAQAAAERFAGTPQFWDGARLLGHEVGASVGAPSWPAWDVYLFYPRGATWAEHLPAPAAALAQAGGVVVATAGTLPAAADQSRLPGKLAGRAVVVGEQADFDALLARATAGFEQRATR